MTIALFSKMIEEIYALRFAQNLEELRMTLKETSSPTADSDSPGSLANFPKFCQEYFQLKFRTEPSISNVLFLVELIIANTLQTIDRVVFHLLITLL